MDSIVKKEDGTAATAETPNKGRGYAKLFAVLVVIGILVWLSLNYDVRGALNGAIERIDNLGTIGIVIFIALYVVACVMLLPGSVLTLGAGAVYGMWMGFVAVSIGSTLGAAAAFLVGRYLARDWVAQKIEGSAMFRELDDAVAEQGWKIVLLTRLTPVFPFNILNYGYGLTKVSFAQYVVASWIGMMPGTVLYVYIGFLGKSAAEGGATRGEWAMRIVAGLATLAVTVMITRMAGKAFSNAVPAEPTSETDSN